MQRAKAHLSTAQDRQRTYANRRRREVQYKVGDLVLLRSTNIRLKGPGSRKLMPKWLGPFSVLECVGPVAVRLQLPDSMSRVHPVFHVSMVKPYVEGSRAQPLPPPPVVMDGEEWYNVQAILSHRWAKSGHRHALQYLVRWEGYSPEHDSWEPAAELKTNTALQSYLERVDVYADKPQYRRHRASQRGRAA